MTFLAFVITRKGGQERVERRLATSNFVYNEKPVYASTASLIRMFTWNARDFEDPTTMMDLLDASGRKTIVIAHPFVKRDWQYSLFVHGWNQEYFIKSNDDDDYYGESMPSRKSQTTGKILYYGRTDRRLGNRL
jgi:alpha-glucosidase (family GH31 glycosyl hydrolase)